MLRRTQELYKRLRAQGLGAALRGLGLPGLLGLIWTVTPPLVGLLLLSRLAPVTAWLMTQPGRGIGPWTLGAALAIGIGVLPASANTLVCGWVFGWGYGLVSAMSAYTLGSVLGYFIGRAVSLQRVDAAIERSESASRVRTALLRSGRWRALAIVTLLRLSGFPLPAGNLLLASCGVPLGVYCAGTFLGLLPRIATATFVSSRAARLGARDLEELARGSSHPELLVLGIVGTILALMLIGYLARQALRRVTT